MKVCALFVLASASLFAPISACNSTRQCGYPYNNPFTTNASAHEKSGQHCCPVMARIPLIDAPMHKAPVRPPSADAAGAVCTPAPADVLVAQGKGPLNGSLYPHGPKIFFVGGLSWDDGDALRGWDLPEWGMAGCATPHPFYTQYVAAYANDTTYHQAIPILGSAAAPPAALNKAADTIAEMLRQMDGKVPGIRDAMVRHAQRFAVWADSERRNDTCKLCQRIDPTFDCDAHIDSRPGRDTSYHPEVPECDEGGGSGKDLTTTFVEEYGIPYLEPNGKVRASYCGTNIVAHEFFHSIHEVAIKSVDFPGFLAIEQATARAVREELYVHHPGAKDDGCNPDFTTCTAFEMIVKAHLTWNGFPADEREFKYRSRAQIKSEAPWLAALVYRFFEDGDWNPALGARIDEPRDQTFGLTCATAPGSALCGEPLSAEFIGAPMSEVLKACGHDCDYLPPPLTRRASSTAPTSSAQQGRAASTATPTTGKEPPEASPKGGAASTGRGGAPPGLRAIEQKEQREQRGHSEQREVEWPGITEPLRSRHYSGLVRVPAAPFAFPWAGATPAVDMHYVYVESESDPSSDPLVLWLQGGPGSSGIGMGSFGELGPLRLDSRSVDGLNATEPPSPLRNPDTWSTFASLLFVDYASVGFSSCADATDCTWDDAKAVNSIADFLDDFATRLFPSQRGATLWIAGESYAGILVTALAATLEQRAVAAAAAARGDAAPSPRDGAALTLGGILHGNGAIGHFMGGEHLRGAWPDGFNTNDMPEDVRHHVDFFYRAGLADEPLYESVQAACAADWWRPTAACSARLREMAAAIGEFERRGSYWNVYNIHDTCSDMPHAAAAAQGHRATTTAVPPMTTMARAVGSSVAALDAAEHSETWYCGGDAATSRYMNHPSVRAAMGITESLPRWELDVDLDWRCSNDDPAAFKANFTDCEITDYRPMLATLVRKGVPYAATRREQKPLPRPPASLTSIVD